MILFLPFISKIDIVLKKDSGKYLSMTLLNHTEVRIIYAANIIDWQVYYSESIFICCSELHTLWSWGDYTTNLNFCQADNPK